MRSEKALATPQTFTTDVPPERPSWQRLARAGRSLPGAELGPVLQRIVAETGEESGGALSDAEREALCKVAVRLHGKPLSFEPVGVAIVESLLQLRIPLYDPNVPAWREMAEWITRALLDSPAARERLRRFWDQQCEAVGSGG